MHDCISQPLCIQASVSILCVGSAGSQDQACAIQILAGCIRVCDSVTLLQRAVEWGTHVSEALRKSAAAAAAYAAASHQQATQANGTSSAQPAPSGSAVAAAAPVSAYCVIQAACAAAAELWGRLQQYIDLPAVRREVSSVASKLLQPLLSVLDNSSIPDSSQAAALQLLAAMLRCIPSSVRPALSSIDRLLQQLVLRTAASTAGSSLSTAGGSVKQQLLAQAAVCAALLPAVAGDAAAWSDAARKLMLSSHDVLDQLLMGLEGRPLDTQYRSYLAVPGATQQQGQRQQSGEGGWLHSLPWQQHEQQQGAAQRRQAVPALLLASFGASALQHLVQQPFAVAVPVPGYSLALLAARLLRFDAAAAVAAGAVPGSSTMYQELLIMQPQLQLAGWQLLHHVVARCGQQLQLQGLLLRLVRQGLRSVQLAGPAALRQQPAAVRCRMYDTAVLLLQATGLAGARALAAEAMGCVVLELYGHTAAASATARGQGATAGQQRPAKRARKSGGASGGELGQFDPAAAVAAAGADEGSRLAIATAADLQAQAGVLAVLKGLLGAGGQLLPAEVRAHADAVAYHISASAAQLAVQLGQQPGLSAAAAAAGGALSALRVAALEALLVSLLVPCSHRPPFLSQAVVLFRQGRSSSDAAVAAVCQSAAVQLEVLMHPRAAAMGVVRQYAGMDGVPALTKPHMWDVFAAEGPAAAGPAGTPAAAAGGAQAAAAAAGVAGVAGFERGQSGLLTSPSAAAGDSSLAAAAGSGVVMGFPVTGGNTAAQNQPGQGQQQQQQPAVCDQRQVAPSGQAPQQHTVVEMQRVQPQNGGTSADGTAVHVQSGAAAQQAQVQPAVQQQQEQQVLQSNAQWAPVVQHTLAAPAVAAAPGTKATAAPVFENESSDSEGPLPDIDSGDSSSEGEDEMES